MYFTRLPDHSQPGFDEQQHFSLFEAHNMIFHATSEGAGCADHVGCLSLKTVLSGEEWFGVDHKKIAVRPGQFLILNDTQRYSSRIPEGAPARTLSIFFRKEFARSVFHDLLQSEASSLDDPAGRGTRMPEFFQTLHPVAPRLQRHLSDLISDLEAQSLTQATLATRPGATPRSSEARIDEHLLFLLRYLIQTHRSDLRRSARIDAVKAGTRQEIYKRLCIARDLLHSSYMEKLELETIATNACLSVPQLVRHFRSVFRMTPHRYLANLRLELAARLLKEHPGTPVHDIAWQCGFVNTSAFCRSFRMAHGVPPEQWRNSPLETSSLPSSD